MISKALFGLLAVLFCAKAILGITIISKSECAGRSDTNKTTLTNSVAYAIIHHTAGVYCSTKATCIQQIKNSQYDHIGDLGCADIGYNFLIGGNGYIYEGRGWNVMGTHASIYISLMGNYNSDTPTSARISAVKCLLAYTITKSQI